MFSVASRENMWGMTMLNSGNIWIGVYSKRLQKEQKIIFQAKGRGFL